MREQPLDEGINGSTDSNAINYCESIDKHILHEPIIVVVVPQFVHVYADALSIFNTYSTDLQHQQHGVLKHL
ncbi:hypothetical protein D9619_009635 [Psilocybe cf. subviscida]|uniref:Uncharacterized protein n=1 Tax=Psilocybe cf. subviscida TaxID=2480587 RepID=A0A8H5BLG2_9AGAR|nr:hypothetical protein D9619_009635 [Psilocybe cf. subviscida]